MENTAPLYIIYDDKCTKIAGGTLLKREVNLEHE